MDRVECQAGFSSCDHPIALWWQGQRLVIEMIEKEWRKPNAKCYRVTVTGNLHFDIVFIENHHWRVQPL
ncbi:MAG TPA: hypothetical protein G4N92_08455 [Anaerolineae bacterium]|nr:hypothetical protein [Anaerolineae bacterium]